MTAEVQLGAGVASQGATSALLYPAAGEALVLGFIPARRERAFLRQITLIAGNRNRLVWPIRSGPGWFVCSTSRLLAWRRALT